MKKMIYMPFLLLMGGMASAEYTITVPLTQSGGGSLPDNSISITADWQNGLTDYSDWNETGEIYGCSNWTPLESSIKIGQKFTQNATDCSQNFVRTAQDKEIERISGIAKNKGASYIETQTITVSDTREAVGSLESWIAATPAYTSWVNTNALYGCTNWSPAGSTKTATATFTQTSTNCKTDQSRTRQEREQESTTLTYRNVGDAIEENKTILNESATRSYTVTLGVWTDNGENKDCTNWTPDPSTYNQGVTFTQTATDCKLAQARSRVEKYVDHNSGATIQVSSTIENQTLTGQTSTRSAIGTKVVAITPSISSFKSYNPYADCNGKILAGSITWSGSNVSYYVISGVEGTKNLGSTKKYAPKTQGKYTITAYSSTGHTASKSVTLWLDYPGGCG